MSSAIWIGLALVIVSAAAVFPMLFSSRPQPATSRPLAASGVLTGGSGADDGPLGVTSTDRGPSGRPASAGRSGGTTDDVFEFRIPVTTRLRGVLGLAAFVAGAGLALAAVLGTIVFAVGIVLH